MIPPFRAYLFDVDGTLVDSAADICGTIQQVLHASGRTDVSDALLRRYIGRHLFDLFADLGFPQEAMDPLLVDYRARYTAADHPNTSCLPGRPGNAPKPGRPKIHRDHQGHPDNQSHSRKIQPYKIFQSRPGN